MEEVILNQERQKEARRYARIRRRLMVVDLVLGGAYLLVWLIFGWSADLRSALLNFTGSQWLLVATFAAVFGGIYYLIDLPLSYYSGFMLPHRFNQSNQTLSGWVGDEVKGLLVSGILGLLLLEIVYALLRAFPVTWWLWAGAVLLFFTVLLSNLSPVLLMPLFFKFQPLDEEHADLAERLIRLAERAGTKVRGVYKFDMSRRTKAANAALTGLGNTRRIILGDTLLNEFTDDEIETVLAHELGHQVHKDILVGIIIESGITLLGLYLASLGLRWGVNTFGFEGVWDVAALPLFGIVMGLFGLITMPLTNAYSRWRERRADEYALESTHKPKAFAAAMTRLANQNLSDADPEPWVVFLLYSHPPLRERIAMAEAIEM